MVDGGAGEMVGLIDGRRSHRLHHQARDDVSGWRRLFVLVSSPE